MDHRQMGARVLYLVRHAHAGNKHHWTGRDDKRPLSPTGRREANGLVTLLRSRPITAIMSSPSLRCQQTVQPLAEQRGLPITLDERLGVHGEGDRAVAMLLEAEHSIEEVALCTHGELIGQVLSAFRDAGAPMDEQAHRAKGSVWLLRVDGDQVADATYLAPFQADRPGDRPGDRPR
jgi:broad specificity phosphatase PhoE